MQSYLEISVSDDPVEMLERLHQLNVYMARSGKMLADAKTLLRRKKSNEITEMVMKIAKEACLSAKAQNALVDSIAIEENELADWLDRITRACVHQSENLRTIVSYTKQQMGLTRSGY